MKIRYSLLILALLFPLVSKSEQNTLTAHRENIMSKPDYTNALTPQERADLIATIKIAMQILVNNSLLEEQKESKFFNSFDVSYPKVGQVDGTVFTKKDLLELYFNNFNKDKIIWSSGGIAFDNKRFNTEELRTLFTPDDFDKELNLVFERANKETVEYKGKEIGSYYLYTYHWKLNNKLKVMFRVQDNFYIKEDNYPRDFYMIDMALDN
ncbi:MULTISPECIES: hypothetical protein [Snodgrassella]|uniref:Uncharacterized protein n=1 Tax=Snodgrassella alvi SCGC AB-598-J21 TaxID=1385367 RepID=A0A074V669_9NEIS|nr:MULTISPECIES: hypothetical protein [Snodgrassella]KEQ00706.1 hypothetical protein SASC598J21_014990 [Snodgrassella alvi SCGC AB-598-J21]MCT6888227.1 hypothetical protein [Lactobacillus sp.]NUF79337.1 hypothetical protein [Snodgrassella sp. ESL0323]OOX78464.1 hypothetical protein BGH94_08670 [Snodgrassella alvi]ORE99853.1 hypothetical protein BGH95_11370 [Snodgrassella alvi]